MRSTVWVALPFLIVPFLGAACSNFGGEDGPPALAPTSSPDSGSPPVIGDPGRPLEVTVGDAKATAFLTQGRALTFPVKLTGNAVSSGPVTITVGKLPKGVTADALTLPAGATDAVLTLHAAEASEQGGPTVLEIAAVAADPQMPARAKLSVYVRGAPGAVDTTFGVQGGSILPDVHSGTAVMIGKWVPDGSRSDLAWGGANGIATINEDALPSVSVDKNGLVLVTLLRDGGLRFMRLTAGGAPDATFGNGGTVVHSFGVNHKIARALVQKDGRIVVTGTEDFPDGST